GDNVGGPGADVLKWIGSDQLLDTNTVNVQSSGTLDLNGQDETVNNTLTLISGPTGAAAVATGAGTLTINNNAYITLNAQTGTLGFTSPATISGNLALQVSGGGA